MISILMPAYIDSIERLEWLNEAVRSVQAQTMAEWELILMDDASPLEIILNEPDERVRRLRMVRRSGPGLVRNTAAALARYEALLPLDADDVLTPDALGKMYDAWDRDRSKVIYGDLQRLEKSPEGEWRPGRTFDLPDYTFQKILDLNGIIPVTAMHSYECHVRAGGWKAVLDAGLEDVEYWISAGKAGFCGQRVSGVVMLYRKHEGSRSAQLRLGNKRESEMRNTIREMHNDVYEGRYPMGCCGGGRPYVPPETFNQNSVAAASTLEQFPASETVWVEYAGQRQGSFGVVGQFTNINYVVDGPGHKLQVHLNDLPKFRRSGRGLDFMVGVAPPEKNGSDPVPPRADNGAFVAPQPQLAQIVQLDRV